jgi:succinoglycan biosynthesis protein ExoA
MTDRSSRGGTLIVVPTLNEARNLASLLDGLIREARQMEDTLIVVVDGGSEDGTVAIAQDYAARDEIALLHNPKRIQSAAMNLAVETLGDGREWLIRVDAHGKYPADYCTTLRSEAVRMGADAVVVPMTTIGTGLFQRAVATAQNSLVGTGGSAHRTAKGGAWVEHGHHALMRIDMFRRIDGYDESFRHNEDAEFDYRLRNAGGRIWLTDRTRMIYYPRATPIALFKQYFGYGRGRARNIFKHRAVPRLRQVLPLAILPVAGLAAFALVHWSALVPLGAWIALCFILGTIATARHVEDFRIPLLGAPLVGLAAMIMHLAWSSGFWVHVFQTMRIDRA